MDMNMEAPGTPESFTPQRPLNVVITGGSAGIGEAVVAEYLQRGHRVLFSYRSHRDNASKISRRHSDATAVPLDQGDINSVNNFALRVKEWLEAASVAHLDILINNAALGSATVGDYCGEGSAVAAHDEALMRVNALGPLWVTRALLPLRIKEVRTVVAMVSSVGGGSAAVFPEYHAADLMSKAAVAYLSKHLAAEYIMSEVDVLCVSPGATETEMFRKSTLETLKDPTSFVKSMPKGCLIQPEHVAESLFYLTTSPCSRMFHGAVIDASMGLAVRPGLQTESRRQ